MCRQLHLLTLYSPGERDFYIVHFKDGVWRGQDSLSCVQYLLSVV